jgi:hypothetical protein
MKFPLGINPKVCLCIDEWYIADRSGEEKCTNFCRESNTDYPALSHFMDECPRRMKVCRLLAEESCRRKSAEGSRSNTITSQPRKVCSSDIPECTPCCSFCLNYLSTCHEVVWGVHVEIHVFLTSALVGDNWSISHPGCFTLVPSRWPSELGWTIWRSVNS